MPDMLYKTINSIGALKAKLSSALGASIDTRQRQVVVKYVEIRYKNVYKTGRLFFR